MAQESKRGTQLRIYKISDINKDLLQELFKKREQGVIHPGFWSKLENSLNNPFMEIHQCSCGEIGLVPFWEVSKHLVDGEWVCKICGEYTDEAVSFNIEKRVDTLLELSREYISSDDHNRDEIWGKVKPLAKGLFPTKNFNEFAFAVDQHQHVTSEYSVSDRYWYDFFMQYFSNAEIQNETKLRKLLDYIDVETANIRLRAFYIKREEVIHIREEEVLRKTDISEPELIATPMTAEEPERAIRNLISGYRSLLENTMPLEIIANLDLIISGKDPFPKPFKKLLNKRGRKIRGIFDMVEYLSNLESFKSYSKKFLQIYDTHLRNDDAHEQFTIDMKNKVVTSTKYGETKSFEEIAELVASMYSIQISSITVFNRFLYYSNLKGLGYGGIEDVIFYLDFEEVEASIDVYQYIWFQEASKNNVTNLILKPDTLEMIVEWGGFKIVYKVIPEGLEWLMYVSVKKEFVLRIKHIAPSIAYYRDSNSEDVEINGIEFILKNTAEIRMNVDDSFKSFTKHCMEKLNPSK